MTLSFKHPNLPFGELFVSQVAGNFDSRYKFTGKERDEETGYDYFGARYYDSDLSQWLSVDPMSDKYPHQSNYMYCSGNPVTVIDPNGMDEWEVNSTGEVKWIKESKKHILYSIDDEGNRTGNKCVIKDRKILDQLTNKQNNISKANGDENSQDDMIKAFLFLADNTNVEWRLDRYDNNGSDNYALGTNHSLEDDIGSQTSPSSEDLGHSDKSVISMIHSHPGNYTDYNAMKSSMGWPNKIAADGMLRFNGKSDFGLKVTSDLKNANYYTYFPKAGKLWIVNGKTSPSYIRSINSDYKRLFFGTINTR